MATQRTSSRTSRTLTTAKVWTTQTRKLIRCLANSLVNKSKHGKLSPKITAKRLQSLLKQFRNRASKLAKSHNGRTRH